MSDKLEELTTELERAAIRLRTGDLDPEDAARLVEDCARLAAEAGAELDRLTRAEASPDADQLRLPGEGSEN